MTQTKPPLRVAVAETIDRGFTRILVYEDGTRIETHWSRTLCQWVTIPDDKEDPR